MTTSHQNDLEVGKPDADSLFCSWWWLYSAVIVNLALWIGILYLFTLRFDLQ